MALLESHLCAASKRLISKSLLTNIFFCSKQKTVAAQYMVKLQALDFVASAYDETVSEHACFYLASALHMLVNVHLFHRGARYKSLLQCVCI